MDMTGSLFWIEMLTFRHLSHKPKKKNSIRYTNNRRVFIRIIFFCIYTHFFTKKIHFFLNLYCCWTRSDTSSVINLYNSYSYINSYMWITVWSKNFILHISNLSLYLKTLYSYAVIHYNKILYGIFIECI